MVMDSHILQTREKNLHFRINNLDSAMLFGDKVLLDILRIL